MTGTAAAREWGGRPIRVARIITRLNVGGPATQAMLLSQRLDPARFETLLVTGLPGPREGNMADLRPEPGVTPLVLPRLRREISPADDLFTIARLVAILRSFRPHVVHTHLSKAGALGRIAAKLASVPIVVHTFHGNVLEGYFGSVRSTFFLAIERMLARTSTRLIAISSTQARELRDRGIADSDKVVVVPLGLDLAPFMSGTPGRLRAQMGVGDRPLIGLVGRLVRIKRVDVFLEAAALLAASRPDVAFVVVGDGDLREDLIAQRDHLGLADRVHFLGWRSDLADIYADLDVLALTSDNEGTPVAAIEAMAAGRAVVATAVGGVPDVISSATGILVKRRDPEALAREVAALIRDPEQRALMGDAGRRAVFSAYDFAALRDRITELYTELVHEAIGDESRPGP